MTNKGPVSDRNLHTDSPIYSRNADILSDGEHRMVDTGFAGDGDIIF